MATLEELHRKLKDAEARLDHAQTREARQQCALEVQGLREQIKQLRRMSE